MQSTDLPTIDRLIDWLNDYNIAWTSEPSLEEGDYSEHLLIPLAQGCFAEAYLSPTKKKGIIVTLSYPDSRETPIEFHPTSVSAADHINRLITQTNS